MNRIIPLLMSLLVLVSGCAPVQDHPQASAPEHAAAVDVVSRWIELEGVQNARELGGYPTKSGGAVNQSMILRTGQLAGATDSDMELLAEHYRVSHIIDLRDEPERESAPDPVMDGAQSHHFDVWPREVRIRILEESTFGSLLDSELYKKNYYSAFALEPSAIEAYRQMFDVLLSNDSGSVLIHCVHGKDRTGIAAVLILSALNVEWSVIEQEYLLSNTALPGSVDLSALEHYRNTIEEGYGGMENYLETELGLDQEKLQLLRERYTSPSGE